MQQVLDISAKFRAASPTSNAPVLLESNGVFLGGKIMSPEFNLYPVSLQFKRTEFLQRHPVLSEGSLGGNVGN